MGGSSLVCSFFSSSSSPQILGLSMHESLAGNRSLASHLFSSVLVFFLSFMLFQMPQLKSLWAKFKSSATAGRAGGEQVSDERNNVSVNEEYMQALMTKSYVEILSTVQEQLRGRTTTTTEDESSPSPSSVSSFSFFTDLRDQLLEPPQEILMNVIESCSSDHHIQNLLIEYFECTLEACKICVFLLQNLYKIRTHYLKLQRIINETGFSTNDDNDYDLIFWELTSLANLANPLSGSTSMQFHQIHDRYELVLHKLTKTHKKIEKRLKLINFCKKAAGVGFIVTLITLQVLSLILTVHSLAGITVCPALLTASLGFLKRRIRSTRMGLKTSVLFRVSAQVDAAAKGVYILNKDFDTVHRLVMRLNDEIEHTKNIAEICVRNQNKQLLMEVVREFKTSESCFLEKLEELEEHIYLCFLTIKRARRLVLEETLEGNA